MENEIKQYRYVRTKDGFILEPKKMDGEFVIDTFQTPKGERKFLSFYEKEDVEHIRPFNTYEILKESNKLEELCDVFVVVCTNKGCASYSVIEKYENAKYAISNKNSTKKDCKTLLYGAIWDSVSEQPLLNIVAKLNRSRRGLTLC